MPRRTLAISLCILSLLNSKVSPAAARQLAPDSARVSLQARQSATPLTTRSFAVAPHDEIVRVYDEADNVIETHEQTANGICMPLHKTPKPTWSRVLACSNRVLTR